MGWGCNTLSECPERDNQCWVPTAKNAAENYESFREGGVGGGMPAIHLISQKPLPNYTQFSLDERIELARHQQRFNKVCHIHKLDFPPK